MNHGTWGGEIIRTNNEVRSTTNSRVTDVFMKLPNEDNEGFIFMSVDAWEELADEIAELPKGTYLEFIGRVNTRSYDGKNGKVYVTSLVVHEIVVVEIPEQEPEEKPKRSTSKSSTGNRSSKPLSSHSKGNSGRSTRQGSKR